MLESARQSHRKWQKSEYGGGDEAISKTIEPMRTNLTGEYSALQPTSSSSKSPETVIPERFGLIQLKVKDVISDSLLPTCHLDVVAIHGLNGNAFTTWTNKQNKSWLQAFLPSSLPGARIYTFGYDSTIFSQSKADIGDYARKLLSELTLVRQSATDQTRGIVFICHNLGGIVCKKALVLAHEASRYTDIIQATKAIVFFGTPHAGSEQADLGSMLANIVNTIESISLVDRTFGRTRQDLVRMLKPRSIELENLSMSFTERSKNLEIVSFYEENAMPPFKFEIVPRASARIGVSNEELIPLSNNHRDMCRLEDVGTLAYRKIVQICQNYGAQSNEASAGHALNIQEQDCLMALNLIDMDECRAQLRPHTPGTCAWILSNSRLLEWISEDASSLLYITGSMGTGKSILTSYLVNHIRSITDDIPSKHSHKLTVCSFFCDDKDIGRKHGQAILRGLLYQILHQRHDLIEHATTRVSEVVPGRWSLVVLWEILKEIMLNPITGTIVLVIDAMDECEPTSRDRVLTSITQFLTLHSQSSSNNIKFLISSRPTVDLAEEIGQYSSTISLDDDNNEILCLANDILMVVKNELDQLAVNTRWPANTRDALEKSIVMKADRNFLWVRLVIQRLKRGPQTRKFLQQVVDESPRDLDGLYCRVLTDIDEENQVLAAKILRILVGALRPITTAELRLALAIDLNHHRTLESVEEESDMAIERTVRLALGSLVRIHDRNVHLIHQSAKEFLLRLSAGKVAGLTSFAPDIRSIYGVSLQVASHELATICIAFLLLDDFEECRILDENVTAFDELPGAIEDSPWFLMQRASDSLPDDALKSPSNGSAILIDQKPPFFEYSALNWTAHLFASGASAPQDVLKSAVRLSCRNTNCLANWSDQYRLSSWDLVKLPNNIDPLIVAAFFGLIYVANEVLNGHLSEIDQNSKPLSLSWASRMGHAEIVKTLLNHATPVSGVWIEGRSPISWACAGGHLEVIKLLLEKADTSQVNERDENGRTPISLAVGSGHLAITELLLARDDIDVNMADRTGSSPLLWAIGSIAEKLDLMLLRCLVSDPRVDIAWRDRYGRTVLSWAAEMGALDAITTLIQSPRPDVQALLSDPGDTSTGRSPISWAAFNGHLEVIEAICKTGKVDIQLASVDKRGQNVFSLAADRNQPEIIKLLAIFYPQGIDCQEESGRTPLSCAMWGSPSNAETVRALLRTGLVDVNKQNFTGRTPLSYAAAGGRADLVRILVEEGGADLDLPDNDGNLPGDVLVDWRASLVKEEIERLRRVRPQRSVPTPR